jgi:hypothetical protein
VAQHLRECLLCRRLLASLSQTVRVLGSLRDETRSELVERIVGALPSQASDGRSSPARVMGGDRVRWIERAPRLRDALQYCLRRSQLRLTVPIGLLAGAALSFVNNGDMLLEGQFDLAMCASCALDFLVPFVAMNIVLLAATKVARRR